MAITLQRWPLIGRRAELEVFERALCSGRHAGLVIHGRAGVGKTRLGELLAHTRALGARHAAYGVRAADYRTVGEALLAALAGVLGDGFDAQTREAWAIAYNLVAETMLEGAASARPIGT